MREIPNEPLCEACHRSPATALAWNGEEGWNFVCDCQIEHEQYSIKLSDWESNNPHAKDWTWRKQLRTKTWFDESDFDEMLARYYKARATA